MVPQTASHYEGTDAAGSSFLTALAPRQVAIMIAFGIVFWFIAALVVRFDSPLGFFGPGASAIAFVLGIPVCWLSVRFIKQIARLKVGHALPGIALGHIVATACDGRAQTWARWLYGFDPALITFGAAWILWGVGLFSCSRISVSIATATMCDEVERNELHACALTDYSHCCYHCKPKVA